MKQSSSRQRLNSQSEKTFSQLRSNFSRGRGRGRSADSCYECSDADMHLQSSFPAGCHGHCQADWSKSNRDFELQNHSLHRLVYISEPLLGDVAHEQWPRLLLFLDWPWRWIEQAHTGKRLSSSAVLSLASPLRLPSLYLPPSLSLSLLAPLPPPSL